MRESEITPELIELSKRAKELGFLQGVTSIKEGDWLCDSVSQEILLVTEIRHHVFISAPPKISIEAVNIEDDNNSVIYDDPYDYTLILSFSRCLEWLRERAWELRTLQERTHRQKGFERWHIEIIKVHPKMSSMKHHYMDNAKTHHEAIAKSICRILEENKDATTKR